MKHPVCAKCMFAICKGEEVKVIGIPEQVLGMSGFNDVFYVELAYLTFQNDMVKYLWVTKYQEEYIKKLS